MKFKKTLFIIVTMNFFTLLLSGQYEIGTSNKAKAGNWNFEFYNKSGNTIDVTIRNEQYSLIAQETVYPSSLGNTKFRIKDLNTKNDFYIIMEIKNIYNNQKYTVNKHIKPNSQREQIYLTFDDKDVLRPQTGAWKGFGSQVGLGKTDSGLRLNKNKNVKAAEIEESKHNYQSLIKF